MYTRGNRRLAPATGTYTPGALVFGIGTDYTTRLVARNAVSIAWTPAVQWKHNGQLVAGGALSMEASQSPVNRPTPAAGATAQGKTQT